jgi:poly(3-hydroxybutyrate) depolymerase
MDLTAEFYLQTVDTVFIKYALAKGEMMHRGKPVDPSRIRNAALLTIEGENDDITGHGQTEAAHGLTPNIPAERKAHYTQLGVGHYGVFNGSRFRSEIAPRIADFIRSHAQKPLARTGTDGDKLVSLDARRRSRARRPAAAE